jgi:ferric iron reductase protein FhuF
MIPLLTPLFQGDWAPLGETLACAAQWPADAVPVSRLVDDPALLGEALRRHATHLGVTGGDLRAASSTWSLAYLWALLPPVSAAASVLQHRFPMRAEDVAVSLDASGTPARFHVLRDGDGMPGTPAVTRYGPLLAAHLGPLFQAIAAQTRLAPKILWGNAARYLDVVFDQALALTGHAAHVAADRQALLQQATWPDGRPNPLHAPQRTSVDLAHGQAVPVTLHRQCCLSYLLPGQGYCGACPLSPEHVRNAPRHDPESVA